MTDATAKALIQRLPDIIGNIDIDASSFAKHLFKKMGFDRRTKHFAKVPIPDGARKEIEYLLHHVIAAMVERHNMPHLLIPNIDQTPLKYVSVKNFTLTEKIETSVTL